MFGAEEYGEDALMSKLEGIQTVIEQVNKQFRDPVSYWIFGSLLRHDNSLKRCYSYRGIWTSRHVIHLTHNQSC